MKRTILFALLISCQSLLAQKLDSVKIDGSYYYVYPYPQKAYPSANLVRTLNAKDKAILNSEKGLELTDILYGDEYDLDRVKLTKSHKKMLRKNAEMSYQIYAEGESDLIPSLDRLPDGKYVQYFQKYWKFDQNDQLVIEKNKVAGYFSLKNNLPHGNALWVDMAGDTAKAGKYSQGLKEGQWITSSETSEYLYMPGTHSNRLVTKNTFANGVLNGPSEKKVGNAWMEKGNYKDGKPSGEWFIYGSSEYLEKGKWVQSAFLMKHYTIAESEIVSHKPYIRSEFNDGNFPAKYFTFPGYFESTLFLDFSRINMEEEDDLELPEEALNSYDGEMYDEGDYGDYGDESLNSIWIDGKSFHRNKLADSLGLINLYQGVYEEFWENGKLKFRYEYKNGQLVEEDTIFWDNGKPADVIVYDAAKKQYEQRKLDYDGTLYEVNLFDSIGVFTRQTLDPLYKDKHILIDGLYTELVEDFVFTDDIEGDVVPIPWNSFRYEHTDTLMTPGLQGEIVLSKFWYGDSTPYTSSVYDAGSRTVTDEVRSLNGTLISRAVSEYDEKFDNVRGSSVLRLSTLEMKKTFNGSYTPLYRLTETDSIPAMRLQSPFLYEMTEDQVLTYKDEPFNGKLTVNPSEKSTSFSISKNAVTLNFSSSNKFVQKLQKDYLRYLETGKTKQKAVLSAATTIDVDYYSEIVQMFPELNFMMAANKNASQTNTLPVEVAKIQGSYLNGKPSGVWKSFDTKGKLIIECAYLNGNLDGEIKIYAYAKSKAKKKKTSSEWEYSPEPSPYDTFPAKPVYYLSNRIGVKNGILNGELQSYDWQGKIKSRVKYVDGYPEGPASEHNAIASTYLNFENGVMDGIVKTYLHLPGRDSILLYELNFQDGALQGESRSYHTNGKLSKRGFFLNGQPIDDYEGYDSLGTRFHYVKFQYSFPVEEKIWEANELSVRYLFDWRDSIYFRPDDITQATSVDNLLYQYGLMGNEYSQPYFGRPSLIDKSGINYHMTKYFPNDTISRDGDLSAGKKTGCWQFFAYDGEKLYEVEYFDSIITLNDSIQFKSKGLLFDYDRKGNLLSKSYIIEKFEKYDCAHTDHYEIRQFYTIWQAHDSLHRINGYVKNYYDNGVLQSEGNMKGGLPTGIWKYYDPFGKLNHVGEYKLGKRDGRWLSGDLSKSKYLGDICMNPNLPNLEEQMKYQEKMLDIYIRYFKNGKLLNSEYYDLNLNEYEEGEEGAGEMQFDPEEER